MRSEFLLPFVFFIITLACSSYAQDLSWQSCYGPQGEEVCALKYNIDGTLLAGTTRGAIYYSQDQGKTWDKALTPSNSYGEIVNLSNNNSGDLFAATMSIGIIASFDYGRTWKKIGPAYDFFYGVAVNSEGFIFAVTQEDMIYRSKNGGESWDLIYTDPIKFPNRCIYIDNNGSIFVGTLLGILVSRDNGENWNLKWIGMSIFLSITKNEDGKLIAGSDKGQIYQSDDSGESWSLLYQDLPNKKISAIHAPGGGVLLAASSINGMLRSTDSGKSWFAVENGLPAERIFGFLSDPYGKTLAYTSSGIFSSPDQGGSWNFSCAIGYPEIICMLISRNDEIFIGTNGHGIFKSTGHGNSWKKVNNSLSVYRFVSLCEGPSGDLWACSSDGKIFYSNDGENWTPTSEKVVSQNCLCMNLNSKGHIFVGTDNNGILKSIDNGLTWNAVNNGLSKKDIISLCVDRHDNIFAGTLFDGLYQSNDCGESWSKNMLNVESVKSIFENDDGRIWVNAWPICYSDDNGLSWQYLPNSINNINSACLIVNKKNTVYIGSWTQSLSRYLPDAKQWEYLSSGLLDTSVVALAFDSRGYLYAATLFQGVFKSTSILSQITERDETFTKEFQLVSIYPNPFNSRTHISFFLEKNGLAKISIHNILGEEVATIFDKNSKMGRYIIDFDAQQLSSGVYYCRACFDSKVEVKKMVLIR